ncbi:hypothetical protein AB1Y20_002169 [Prymnesium parvum]|uniref:Uncharacterized protein n=1 Tax=Prymnesium parvum TaxID=97485 RepID=A0AB34J8C7_PRYPA
MSCSRQPHVVFHDDHVWTEGGGAKWRFVKYGLWLTLRLRQLVGSEDVQWLPNPAQMQNPQMSRRRPSMMGALGIVQPTAPPPVLANRSAAWLGERVRLGEYRRVNLELHPTENSGAERKALAAIADTSDPLPLAFYAVGPSQPMHWHGSAGAWLHHCFFLHRKRRSRRAAGANGGASERGGTLLELDRWLPRGAYLVGVHVRDFTAAASAEWNLPASYYAGLVAAVFNATPLSCANTRIVVLGPPGNPAVEQLSQSFECATVEARLTIEIHSSPQEDPTAGDDYTPEDDDDDAVRGQSCSAHLVDRAKIIEGCLVTKRAFQIRY